MTIDLKSWTPCLPPPRSPIAGRFVRIEPFKAKDHLAGLWQAYSADSAGRIWDYLPYGPFADADAFYDWGAAFYASSDPMFHVIRETATNVVLGIASLMRITPAQGVIEVGHICYGPALQARPGASEAQYLLARRVFDELGYRRYEWKCNNANAASKRAAERLGFTFEGVFHQHMIVKGRNRDTAWFSMLDKEWPACKAAFENWLSADNFDEQGRQLRPLADFREDVDDRPT
ncbi:MAG: N-acetyltransferase [Alphaproteobacteria bacterium]|nr:MAG: N-acetyltransferase [Alphaproteobacteria bacterium]